VWPSSKHKCPCRGVQRECLWKTLLHPWRLVKLRCRPSKGQTTYSHAFTSQGSYNCIIPNVIPPQGPMPLTQHQQNWLSLRVSGVSSRRGARARALRIRSPELL
jgi:hypothetical protein